MATEKELLERQKEVSGQVSAQTRASALGLLAISWALLTAHDQPLQHMAAHVPQYEDLALSFLAVGVLVFDLLQYVFYTQNAVAAVKRAEDSPIKEAIYDYDAVSYKAARFCYYAKFVVLVVAAGLLLLIFIKLLSQ